MRWLRHAAKAILPAPFRSWLRRLYLRIEPLFYLGNRVECPCCGARYARFLPFGRPPRPNARCARCDALERHRALALFLARHTPLRHLRPRLLHFAPERALRQLLAASCRQYLTTDYEERAGIGLRMDITRLALREATVDAILCVHVLEHIPDDHAALGELYRVLRPGGWAILQVPLDPARDVTYEDPSITRPEDRRRHFNQEDHVRVYGRDFAARLRQAGFVVEIHPFGASLAQPERERYGIAENEEIYFCRKPGASGAEAPL